jgi:DNA-binding CsgD family transcriptional regulator/tetratricopeptide (TPR) repeat protein
MACVRGGLGVRRAAVVVGRATELDELLRAVRSARSGRGSSILLLGEGGVGKTRLLGEAAVAARQAGIGLLSARAPITTPVAFSVVAEALRSWLRGHAVEPRHSPLDRGLQLVLPEWPTTVDGVPELSAAQLRLLALEGIVQVVRDIAAENGGVVVLLDDLHAADAESLEAIRYLATAEIDGAVVVGALRPGEASLPDELIRTLRRDRAAQIIELTALDERAVTDLVAALLDAQPPEPLVADIMARTDGIPLLVEEVLDAHLRAGSLQVGASETTWRGGTVGVPKTVRGMVEARLERLTGAERDVLVAGAVVGDFEPAVLTRVVGTEPAVVRDAVTAGIRVGLLETTGGAMGFRHAIIREAVLDATVPHTVDALHRRAADALDDGRADAHSLERRARHLAAAGEDDAATRLFAAAADASERAHALLAAEWLARAALDLAPTTATRAVAADALASSLTAQGRWQEALDIDETTVAHEGETPERRIRMAMSALEAGRSDRAGAIIERALAAGDDSRSLEIAAGRVALVNGDGEAARAYAERVFDVATRERDVGARLSALELKGRAHDFLGDRDAAVAAWTQQADEAAARGHTQAQLRAVVQLGKVELFAGRPPARLYEAVELARAAGAFVELGWAEENLAIGVGIHGDIVGSALILDEAIERCRRLHLDQLAYLVAARGITESFRGDEFEEWFIEAETLAPTDEMLLHTTGMRGDCELRRGRFDAATRWFRVADEIQRRLPGVVPSDSQCWLVWSLAGAGRIDDARAALDAARAIPDLERWYGRPVVIAAGDALLDRDDARLDEVIRQVPVSMDVALMRMLGAEILEGPARVQWLREAFDIYEGAGATVTADRVRRLLREAGGPVPRRRRRSEPVPADLAAKGVTAREAEVLRLVGDGLSNPEIAGRLFLSVRTVETHVSSLLQKLGARTRGQLTAMTASIDFSTA